MSNSLFTCFFLCHTESFLLFRSTLLSFSVLIRSFPSKTPRTFIIQHRATSLRGIEFTLYDNMPPKNNVSSLGSGVAGMKLDSSSSSKWANKMSTAKEGQPKTSSVAEQNDGWTTVSSTKPRTIEKPALRTINGNRNVTPSHAAQSRRSVYETPTKPRSNYKQAHLPPDERDPELYEIELNKGSKYRKSDFRAGLIIRAMVHEQDYQAASSGSNVTITERNRSNTKFGPICTKWRKMIVLSLFEDHYLAIPLFTHNGKGLVNKKRPEEFVSIRDHRAKGEHPEPQSCHQPLETENINDGIDLFDVKSTAHVTYALSRKYELPVVMEGQLKKKSINRLVNLFNLYAPKYIKDASGKVVM